MAKLTAEQIANLRWMQVVNDEQGISLFWPSVRKFGPIPECDALVSDGLAELRSRASIQNCRGYWITDAGRAALTSIPDDGQTGGALS